MRRFAECLLVLLALAGFLAAGTAEARMWPGTGMVGMADCPHPQAGSDMDHGAGSNHAAGKALALMTCCFGVSGSLAAEAVVARPPRHATLRFHPVSDVMPPSGIIGPEPPPPRA